MNPSIFVSVSTEPGISSAPRENIRYDLFVSKLLKELPEALSACHIAMGISGELGELFADNCDEFEEFGDYEFYLQAALNHYGLTLVDCANLEYVQDISDDEFVYWTGQLVDCIKREYIYNKSRELDRIKYCINRLSIYLHDAYTAMETSRQQILQFNAEKLEVRYAGLYYSDEAAQARADKA